MMKVSIIDLICGSGIPGEGSDLAALVALRDRIDQNAGGVINEARRPA
jgi:hypothetical protein